MTQRTDNPLFGEVPQRVLLDNAPLVRVLGQVRFPKIVKIGEESYIADFQEAVRKKYPHFQSEMIQGVEVNLVGQEVKHRVVNTPIWRFLDGEGVVRLSLAQDAITLETARYISRDDFLDRMEFVLRSLEETISPSLVQRVGFRYVDRLSGDGYLGELQELVQPELLNVLQPNLTSSIDIAMSEISAATREGKLIVRYGLAPENFSHDADVAPPVNQRSWVLDVDSYSTNCDGQGFDVEMLRQELDKVAGRAYAFFRWSVTDAFLARFGVK